MKITRILAALTVATLASAPSMAAFEGNFWKYVWTGDAGDNSYTNGENWDTVQNEGELTRTEGGNPASSGRDWAYIGYNVSVADGVTIFTPDADATPLTITKDYNGAIAQKLFLHQTTLNLSGGGDVTLPSELVIGDGSSVNLTGTSAFGGLDGTSTLDLTSTAVAGQAAKFTLESDGGNFWGGTDKVLNFKGTIDTSGLTGTGSITLATIDIGESNYGYGWYDDAYGISVSFDELSAENATFAWVPGVNSSGNLVMTYDIPTQPDTPAIPEPTTATLSLLALAGLAARRRRK